MLVEPREGRQRSLRAPD